MKKMKKTAILFAMVAVMLMAMAVVSFATAPKIADVDITISGTTVSVTGTVENAVSDQEVTVLLVSDAAWSSSNITDGVIKYIDQIQTEPKTVEGVTVIGFSYNFTLDQEIIDEAADYTLIHGGTSVEVGGQSVLPLAEASGYTVSGTVTSFVKDDANFTAITSVKVALKDSVKGNYVSEIVTAQPGSGTFAITGVQNGTYVLEIKREGYLTRFVNIVVNNGNVLDITKSLLAGDSQPDGTVGLGDYSKLAAAYNSSYGGAKYKVECDYNLDTSIGLGDYSLLAANYNKTTASYNEANVDLTK